LSGNYYFVLKKTYFISDIHLGFPNETESRAREKLLVQWLDEVRKDADAIYIVGDLFDFWFEYGKAIPKNFARAIGKLAELADAGIKIHLFTGNHDLWMFGYFTEELGIPVYHKPIRIEIQGKKFFIGHGDGLGPGDNGYKFLKKIFTNPVCRFLFKWLHPDIGIALAHYWSRESRFADGIQEEYKGSDKEWLLIYSKEQEAKHHHDFFIFGHRHLPLDIQINPQSRYINLGDWLTYNSYAVFDGNNFELKSFTNHKDVPLAV
jgi:UDP-2,3-diacylglucosamine hydrolase